MTRVSSHLLKSLMIQLINLSKYSKKQHQLFRLIFIQKSWFRYIPIIRPNKKTELEIWSSYISFFKKCFKMILSCWDLRIWRNTPYHRIVVSRILNLRSFWKTLNTHTAVKFLTFCWQRLLLMTLIWQLKTTLLFVNASLMRDT